MLHSRDRDEIKGSADIPMITDVTEYLNKGGCTNPMVEINHEAAEPAPQNHRTVDRVTHILEEIVYHPGRNLADMSRVLDAPKSSVHKLIHGLIAAGWIHEDQHRFYLGPAVYGLTLATGHIRAGLITDADLSALHEETDASVFLGVRAGDNLIYVAEAGSDTLTGFVARTSIRQSLLDTAGGKALLAAMPEAERLSLLRRHRVTEAQLVGQFLAEYDDISSSGIAQHTGLGGARLALATAVRNKAGEPLAEVTLVGSTPEMGRRLSKLSAILLHHVERWQLRLAQDTAR